METIELILNKEDSSNHDCPSNTTSRMTKLEVLDAYNNNFSGPLPGLVNLNQLEYLNVGGNYFLGEVPSFIKASKVGGFSSKWEFSGNSLWILVVLRAPSLRLLAKNSLLGHIPTDMFNLTSLKELDLAVKEPTGRTPECFSQLKQLGLLNLFENKMDGPIPGSIGELPNLCWLGLWSNNFDFGLPQYLGWRGDL
ncbi:hypothetical protein Cgig2_004252 [Carnegiea gigantea]|uniref:Uncharacterized protein n=1 Tax=Carnegiea gigantea TaxID=171969 RepID=A0A9Q1KGY3_9CARY|nr:hypothetical protein Cgig2_004252 [Carnegiea gigantea]